VTELATFDIRSFDGYRLVVASGEIDISNVGEFRTALQQAAPAGSEALIVSLACITYMDSNALAALIDVNRRFEVSRRQFHVVCPPDGSCSKLLNIAGLHNVLSMHESTEDAVAGLATT
jgi:anti-anti-sigma factor